MSGPWENYQSDNQGPWAKYQGSQQQSSPPPETKLNQVANAITGAMNTINMGSGYKGPVNTLEPQGQNLFNKMGGNVAEYLGGKNLPGNPYTAAAAGTIISSLNPENWMSPVKEGPATIPGQGNLQEVAQDLGRRSLGISKGMIKRMKGGIPEANQAAQEMLDQGVIQPFSGAKATLGRAEDVAATSGKGVGEALKSAGQNALDTNHVSSQVIDQLAPKFQGGAYGAQEKIANEILDTIGAHGDGPIDFESAQRLKNTLKQMAGNNWNTDKLKASMYQKAYGIVSDAMEKGVQNASQASNLPVVQSGSKTGEPHALFAYNDQFGPGGTDRAVYNVYGDPNNPVIKARGWGSSVPASDLEAAGIPIVGKQPNAKGAPAGSVSSDVYPDYLRNKQIYGASQKAIAGLEDKAAAEASNSLLSLRGSAIGAGALASGHLTPALEALGVWEAARRVGTGTGAYALNKLAQPVSEGIRRAALASFIDKVTTKPSGQQ